MKLKEIKRILQAQLTELEIKTEQSTANNQTFLTFKGAKNYRMSVEKIAQTGLFKNEIDELRNTLLFTSGQPDVRVINNEARVIVEQTDRFKKLATGLLETLKEVTPEENPDSVSIKLPNVTDFEDLSRFSSDFHKVLSQAIINEEIGGKVEISSVENGSIWLDVLLGSSAAVTLVAGLAWSGAVIFKKIQEGRILEKQVKALDIKNDGLKEIQEKQKIQLDQLVEMEAKHLFSENFKENDPEQIERLKHSIKLLADLLFKGAEVHPALQAPEKVSNLFPDFKNLELLESKIKKIGTGG